MKKSDVVGIMAILETAYPTYYAKRSNQQRMEAVNLWAELFREPILLQEKACVIWQKKKIRVQ